MPPTFFKHLLGIRKEKHHQKECFHSRQCFLWSGIYLSSSLFLLLQLVNSAEATETGFLLLLFSRIIEQIFLNSHISVNENHHILVRGRITSKEILLYIFYIIDINLVNNRYLASSVFSEEKCLIVIIQTVGFKMI